MALFAFSKPDQSVLRSIQYEDEAETYSLADLIGAVWIHLTNPEPIANWLNWYRLLARLYGYARLDATVYTRQSVCSWPSSVGQSEAATHVFRDETGEASLAELLEAVADLTPTKPKVAQRLARMIVHVAEIDQRRDCIAWSLLDGAGLLENDSLRSWTYPWQLNDRSGELS